MYVCKLYKHGASKGIESMTIENTKNKIGVSMDLQLDKEDTGYRVVKAWVKKV